MLTYRHLRFSFKKSSKIPCTSVTICITFVFNKPDKPITNTHTTMKTTTTTSKADQTQVMLTIVFAVVLFAGVIAMAAMFGIR